MRANRTRYAVLGALTRRPMSGYELKSFFEKSVDFFWHESYGQLYPVLRSLARERLIAEVPDAAADRRRLRFKITAAGKKELVRWLAEPARREVSRVEILLKIFFSRHAGRDVAQQQVEAYRRFYVDFLAQLDATEALLRSEHAEADELPFWLLTVSYGRRTARATLDWCDEAEGVLSARAARAKRR
jgi:DNA-binding PadR family transcriptional regulator